MDETIGISLYSSLYVYKSNKPLLILTSSLYSAQRIYDYVSSFINEDEVLLFPNDELLRAESLSTSKEFIATRLYVLNELLNNRCSILISNLTALSRFLPSPTIFKEHTLNLKAGNHIEIANLKKLLLESGYTPVNKIDQSLQFASRGDILDIFSVNYDDPIRIEFFDDEIESIRFFDIASQVSKSKLDEITILPAKETLLSEDEFNKIEDKIKNILKKDETDLPHNIYEFLLDNVDIDINLLLEHNANPKLYKYYSLLTDKHYSLVDYLSNYDFICVDSDSLKSNNEKIIDESRSYLRELFLGGKIISHLEMYQDIFNKINKKNVININLFKVDDKDNYFDIKPLPYTASKNEDAINIIKTYVNDGYKVYLLAQKEELLNKYKDILKDNNLSYSYEDDNESISLITSCLNQGFYSSTYKICVLTKKELFNEKNRVGRFSSRFKEGTILKSFEDLVPGDYVVHEYQGIGQFLSLETLLVDNVHKDFIKIAYFGNEFLYVPLDQFQLVRKYMGKEGIKPRLSHLHSKDWENTKARIKKRINDLADRLYNLYSERRKVEGFAFSKDDELQIEFEKAFPYELTKDQIKSVNEIKADMESTHPMDRLLCGDVGFGKTEVAFIAAYKAILSNKQVAILCPTTLLARQHYEVALERFSPFGVRIAVFSRLIPEAKQKEYIKGLESGQIHLAIGTHRLLSKDIHYKDLGLLIVDEEQRFGVEQKERLKELKQNIDVLTLSATPIPRTLQISLLGVRSLSQINTAPRERMPIQTFVLPYKSDVVKELIEKELSRNGQVYYLHNNVSTIYMTASKIQKMLPNAAIGVAHGQMEKNDIEEVMSSFYNGDIDVLVCTSIIENGIDIANANLIIVEDSENYGLSQLYQIKGRVGRSDRIAYAYLMYNGNKELNDKTKKRLKALQDFNELGSGYKIAQRDLMIRGAGDILGPDQAGYIDSIGLDLYLKLLNEAVKEKETGIIEDVPEVKINTNIPIDAYIPDSYIKEDKIELYQEIMSVNDSSSLINLKNKTIDIYGPLPKEVDLLFLKRNIDLLISQSHVTTFKDYPKFIEIYLGEEYASIKGIGNILFETLIPFISKMKISYINRQFKIVLNKSATYLNDLEGILISLSHIKI